MDVKKLKIAIMGAGLSGLAAAIELERHGIEPVIFEKRSRIGDRFINGEVFFSLFSRPVLDEIHYLSEHHQIYLQPLSNIRQLDVFSENAHASLSGHIGFITGRGRHEQSLESQLAQQVRGTIEFHSERTYENLLQEFTHVILATGDASYTVQIQPFEMSTSVTLIGGIVEGDFQRSQVCCWLDNTLAPHGGNGYLLPLSEREASLVLAYPEKQDLSSYSSQQQWDLFFTRAQKDLKQTLKVVDTFEVNQYLMGLAKHPRIGNTFFVGNCYGVLMPFMGFGQFAAILTGIYAAWDICGMGSYQTLTESLRKSHKNSLVLRRLLEGLDNSSVDKVVDKLNGFWGRMLVDSRHDVLKWAAYLARVASFGRLSN